MVNAMNETLKIGTRLQNGKYVLQKVLGQGATGITYLASMRQTLEGNLATFEEFVDVAIKEFYLKNECARGETTSNVVIPNTKNNLQVDQFKKSFVKEARRIAGLSHPNIVHVLGVFNENDTVYYVMQYIKGGSLKQLIERKGKLSEDEALGYILEIASALEYMHERKNMCHYDLKPGNIMLNSRGHAMLIDFGIAKNYDADGHETSTTPPGLTKGYAPIEQYSSIEGFSPKSDVYSLGATLYHMLLGKVPPEPFAWLGNKKFPECPVGISEEAWNLVRKMMSFTQEERPTMREVVNYIEKNFAQVGKDSFVEEEKMQPADEDDHTIYRDDEPVKENGRSENLSMESDTLYEDDTIDGRLRTPKQEKSLEEPSPQPHPAKNNMAILVALVIGSFVLGFAGFLGFRYIQGQASKNATPTETPILSMLGDTIMTYSGEIVDGKPQGRGVLKYRNDDRLRYEGAFLNGLREDSVAALFYKNGDVYRGSFIADHFATGTFFVESTGEYFRGTFRDDKPYNGVWYDKNDNIISRVEKGK